MRIDKYICDTINITRTQVKQKISKGLLYVDGKCIKSPSFHVDEKNCSVVFDGDVLEYNKYVYIMMNKPAGVLSASTDKKGKTAVDLLLEEDRKKDIFVAGRLDKDTTGFLLLTNDGNFAHNILAPKNNIYKTYEVTLEHDEIKGYKDLFLDGVTIDGEYKCKPARFEYLGNRICELEICEGKFHQVKRMFEALGNKVIALNRKKISDIILDPSLGFGEYRYLTDEEIGIFMNKITKKYC